MLGAAGTAFGGLLIVLNPKAPSPRTLGLVQGLAAGLMLSISFLDLMPHAVGAVGFPIANVCFFAGAMFFALIVLLVPEPSATGLLGSAGIKEPKSPRLGLGDTRDTPLFIRLDPKKRDFGHGQGKRKVN
jgi:ZIP family zinc transporter